MMEKYLLSIEEFLGKDAGRFQEEAFASVDAGRRQKAERIRMRRPQAACLGAGLLLQLAVRDALEPEIKEVNGLRRFTVSGLLDRIRLKPPLPFAFRYGEKGKPYLRNYPFFFNLSHSGDYVICALSGKEVGVDIQQHRAGAGGRIARRYFSEQETAALENCKEDRDALFFRLWTRKEAYGKLTGEGIADAMGVNLLQEAEDLLGERKAVLFGIDREEPKGIRLSDGKILVWEEYEDIPGYSISFCHWMHL